MDTAIAPVVREQKSFLASAERAQAHALYIQNIMPLMIAKILTDQRKEDFPSLPVITAKQVNQIAYRYKWAKERTEYMERQSETIATALEAIKEEAGPAMVAIVKSLHNSFLDELTMIDKIRAMVKTPRDMLDIAKALETVQKRLFHFHALRSNPLAGAAPPMKSVSDGDTVLGGGETTDIQP